MTGRLLRRLTRTLRSRGPAGDDGAVLIFALIIVTTIALVVGAVLTRGDGSLRATIALRSVAGSSYSADAAADIALNDLRRGDWAGNAPKPTAWAYANDPFDGCFGRDGVGTGGDTAPHPSLELDGFYPPTGTQTAATSAVVDCRPENGTGAQGTPVAINNSNKPGNAILTLGTSTAEHGFTFKTNGTGGAFRVRGGIWSSSDIVRDNNGTLESTQYIKARTGCSPIASMSAPTVDCGVTPPSDPAYPSDLDLAGGGVPALRQVPSTCAGGTVELQPGYYDDVTNLNNLTPTGGGSCFVHLNPGTYYLDFHNNSADPLYQAGIAPGSDDVWKINSGVVVGGTLTAGTTIPGRCVSPIDNVAAQGVQIIFGGDSRIAVDKGAQVELCASYHGDRPPIAVYGQRTGATAALTTPPPLTVGTDAPTVSPAGTWIHGTTGNAAPTAADLRSNDGNVVSFTRTGGKPSATITATGFAPGSAIPAGAVLTSATVAVGYSQTAGSSASLTVIPTSASGAGPSLTGFALPGTTPTTQPYAADLSTLGATDFHTLQKYVHDNGLTGASIAFKAGPKANGDMTKLDGLVLTLSYYLPTLRAETTTTIPGNTVATPGGASVIDAIGNNTLFYTQGTTYAPLASLHLALNNISESVFRFGVIARSLDIFETASFGYPGAVIELPDNSPGWGTKSTLVQLKVYLCPNSASCSTTSGRLALTVRAQLWDPNGSVDPPKRQVTVLSWSPTT